MEQSEEERSGMGKGRRAFRQGAQVGALSNTVKGEPNQSYSVLRCLHVGVASSRTSRRQELLTVGFEDEEGCRCAVKQGARAKQGAGSF